MASAPTSLASQSPALPAPPAAAEPSEYVPAWFDRSSITADVMVMIEGVTEEEWWEDAPDNRVCEFWDGVVYMPSPASVEHQSDVGFWFFLLSGFASEREIGEVILGPGVLRLAPGRNLEPDVFVVPFGEGPHDPPALLVVETLSPSTRAHDTGRKAQGYRDAKIPEMIHVDLKRRRIIVSRRVEEMYTTEILERGIWHSASVPGFWLDIEWLWRDSHPRRVQCLLAILAGLPAAPAP